MLDFPLSWPKTELPEIGADKTIDACQRNEGRNIQRKPVLPTDLSAHIHSINAGNQCR